MHASFTFRKAASHRAMAMATALAIGGACTAALAQGGAPVKLMVGFAAGGTTDIIARHLALGMQNALKQTVIVDNRPGAGGQIAAHPLKAARPDGSTLFLSNSHSMSMIPLTVQNPGFDPTKDFATVGLVAINPDVFAINPVVVDMAGGGLREFALWAEANPGKGNVGVPAPASAPDFAVGVIAKALGSPDLRSVPYRGDGPVAQDVMAGQIAAGIGSVGAMLQGARAGKIRILAVNGSTRLAILPEVPTYAELGIKGYEEVIFTGVYAPAGTPPALVARYNAAIVEVVQSRKFIDTLAELGITAAASTPAELAARVATTNKVWSAMVKEAGFTPQ